MHPRAFTRIGILAMLAALIMSVPAVSAQESQVNSQNRAQLAAMTLPGSALPSGFLLQGESFLSAGGDFESAGFVGLYLSVYEAIDGDGVIISYASMWTDPEAAANGFEMLEGGEEGVEQQPLEVGDGPAELSVSDTGQDATFVVDRFVVGVSSENGAVDGEGLESLVSAAAERASTVAGGEAPDDVDLALPTRVLNIHSLGSEVRAGFLTSGEAEQLYGVRGSSVGGLESSWVSLVAVGDELSTPFVSLAVTTFGDADNAARVVDQAADLVPLSVDLQPLDGIAVDGADVVRGFQYASAAGGEADSVRVVMQAGTDVVVIDVQGADSLETAQAAAQSLAAAQVSCLGGTCELPELSLGA